MAITSALFTGLTGLDVNQQELNVVGNNIANVNTVAFKSSRALFKPQFYVTDSSGSPSTTDFGGTNPSQVGLGADVATVEKDFSAGALQTTGKNTDMAIDGDGFFVVQDKNKGQEFTRDGSFTLNDQHQLVTGTGEFVQGYGADNNNNVLAGALQNITVPLGELTQAKATAGVTMQGNLDSGGTIADGASILNSGEITDVSSGSPAAPSNTSLLTDLRDPNGSLTTPLFNVGDTLTLTPQRGGRDLTPLTYTIQSGDTVANLEDFFRQGNQIDTSVTTTPPAPTPGVTIGQIAGDPPTSGRLIITGDLGKDNSLTISGNGFTSSNGTSPLTFSDGVDTNGVKSNPDGESVYTSFVAYDSLGTPLTVNVTATLESTSNAGAVWRFYATSPNDTNAKSFTPGGTGSMLGDGTLTFDSTGKLLSTTGTSININRTGTGATTPLNITMDFSQMTGLTSQQSQMVMTKQDGSPIGTLDNFSVGADGSVVGEFSNGLTKTLGQIALATFNNPEGLVDQGSNLYQTGAGSGLPVISAPQQLGSGAIRSGALEQSNVDLSKEFTNLIIASTGFTASSRVISTSNQLLTELLNTAR